MAYAKNLSEVRNFHRLASFYKRFVNNFSILVAPLNEIVESMLGFNRKKNKKKHLLPLSMD